MKEVIKPKDGKRKLYFTVNMQNYIPYTLDQNTTCEIILNNYKKEILAKLCDIYKSSKIDLNNFDFFLIDLKSLKKSSQNILMKIKLNKNLRLSFFLQNPKTILCFLQKNSFDIESRINSFNIMIDDDIKNNKENEKLLETKKNYLINKQIDYFYENKTLYLYSYKNKLYIKCKGNLSEKQLLIHGKDEIVVYIQEIKSLIFCDAKNPMVENLQVVSGFRPPYFMIIKTNETQIILGLKNEEKLKSWRSGMNSVITNYKNFTTDIDFKVNINDLKKSIAENETSVIDDSLIYENLLKNHQKKKIFYSLFEDKKLPKLIELIFDYQNLVKDNNYKDGIVKLNEILDMVNSNNNETDQKKKSNISEIINSERLLKYLDISNKANELINGENNEKLKEILKPDLFDDSLFYFNQLYITPALNKYKEEFVKLSQTNNKSDSRKNIQSLIAYYFMKIYKMDNGNSFTIIDG